MQRTRFYTRTGSRWPRQIDDSSTCNSLRKRSLPTPLWEFEIKMDHSSSHPLCWQIARRKKARVVGEQELQETKKCYISVQISSIRKISQENLWFSWIETDQSKIDFFLSYSNNHFFKTLMIRFEHRIFLQIMRGAQLFEGKLDLVTIQLNTMHHNSERKNFVWLQRGLLNFFVDIVQKMTSGTSFENQYKQQGSSILTKII